MLKWRKERGISFFTIGLLLALLGCSNKTNGQVLDTSKSKYGDSYPIDTEKTLTWYHAADNALFNHSNIGQTIFAQTLMENTGINLEFINPPIGQGNEKIGIIIASGDLPDIFEVNWLDYPGGPQRLIDDDVIIRLNESIESWAPDFHQFMGDDQNIRKGISTDKGDIYAFPFVRGDDLLRTFWGPFFRKDLLDKYGLSAPETIEDWEHVMLTVKEGEGENFTPLQFMYQNGNPNPFVQAFGNTTNGLYVGDDSMVHYGQYEDEYEDYLALMNRWYKMGLFSLEVSTWSDTPSYRETFLNDRILATVGFPGSGIGYFLDTAKSLEKDLSIISTRYPKLNKDDGPRFGHWVPVVDTSAQWAGITTACEDVELATRLLNYGFTEEGNKLYNFGLEGESYYADPEDKSLPIKYTDKLLNSEESSTTAMIAEYTRANYDGPFVQAIEYLLNYLKTDEQKDALNAWSQDNYGSDKVLPQLTFTDEEVDEVAQIQTDLLAYIHESEAAFISGNRSLSEFEDYRGELSRIGIDRLLELYNSSLERFKQR